MTPLEEKIWNLVHDWCENQEQAANIPDQSRRYLMDLIMEAIPYHWKPYPDNKPAKYGKQLVVRKDGKVHWETWNTSGWAYNKDVITHFCEINKPDQHQTEYKKELSKDCQSKEDGVCRLPVDSCQQCDRRRVGRLWTPPTK